MCITAGGGNESEEEEEEEEGQGEHNGQQWGSSGHNFRNTFRTNNYPGDVFSEVQSMNGWGNRLPDSQNVLRDRFGAVQSMNGRRNRLPNDLLALGPSNRGLRRDDHPSMEMGDSGLLPDDKLSLEVADNGLGLSVDDGLGMAMLPGESTGFTRGMFRNSLRKKRSSWFNNRGMGSNHFKSGFHQNEEEEGENEMEYEEEENENEEEGMFGGMNGHTGSRVNKMMSGLLSCQTAPKKNIQVTRILYGEAVRGGCISQNEQCEEEVDYDEKIVPVCDGQTMCRIHLKPRILKACRGMSNFVGVEYRCVDGKS